MQTFLFQFYKKLQDQSVCLSKLYFDPMQLSKFDYYVIDITNTICLLQRGTYLKQYIKVCLEY